MEQLVLGLAFLAFVWLIVTVCGHVSWVLTAGVLKALFGVSESSNTRRRCPQCGRQSLVNGRCTVCDGVPLVSLEQRSRDDLQATARQLARMQRAGHLPYDQCLALLKVIEHDLSRFGATVPPEVWKIVNLQAMPAPTARATESEPGAAPQAEPAPLQEAAAAAMNHLATPPDALPVIDAVIVDAPETVASPAEGRPAPLATQPVATQPLVLPPAVPPPPARLAPQRTLADMLQGFMEESNIRWGEVFGGLLIVSCAIGLVISLRATLEHIPYFPALLFMLFTVAFHGAGLYTLKRWKLAAVSRAILIIALLLVPLSFSAAVVLSGQGDTQRPLTDPLLVTALVVGLAVFGWVSYTGSRELVGEGALRLTTAVLGCCFAQVVINRGAGSGLSSQAMTGLALLPVTAYLIAAIGQIFRAQAWQRMSSRRIEQTFLMLGISLFALLPPIALLVYKVEPRWPTFVQLAPLLSLVATSVLALGLVVHRRALARQLAPLRTSGTAIALVGGAVLIFLFVVVWPRPELMLNVSLLTGALLLAVAIRTRMPALHGAAVGVLALAAFVAFAWWQHLVRADGTLGVHWLQAALYGRSGLLLTMLAAAIAGVGAWLYRQRQEKIGLAYLVAAGVLASLSLMSAGWSGFAPVAEPWAGDGDLTGPLFLCYGIALLAIAVVMVSEEVLATGIALLWVALIQLLWMNGTARTFLSGLHLLPERPVLVATILEAVILGVLALVLSKPGRQQLAEFLWVDATEHKQHPLIVPLTYGAAVAIAAATPFILWVAPGRFGVHALYALLAALVWGIVCTARRWPAALAALQTMAAIATAFAIAGTWAPAENDPLWFIRSEHLQAQLLALAATASVWSIVRRLARERTVLHQLLHPEFPACDHVLLGLGVALLTLLCVSSALPGMSWELGFQEAESLVPDIAWLNQAHRTRLAWGVAAMAGALIIALADRINGLKLVGMALTGWAGLFLLAQVWEEESATASAARWLLALYGGGLMLLFVFGEQLGRALKSIPILRWKELEPHLREWFRYQPLLLGVLPTLLLTILAVAQNAAGVTLRGPVDESLFRQFGLTPLYAGPLLIGVGIFLGLALGQHQPAFALGGGLLFQLAANLAFILHVTSKPTEPSEAQWAEALQWNTLAASVYALIWCSLAQWLMPREPRHGPLRLKRDPCFLVQVAMSVWLFLAVAVWAAAGVIRFPETLATESKYLGHWSNGLAAGLLAIPLFFALGISRQRRTWALSATALGVLLSAVVPVVAISCELNAVRGSWLAYHLTAVGWLAIAVIIAMAYAVQQWSVRDTSVASQQSPEDGYAPHHAIAAFLCGLVAWMALRGNTTDPQTYFSTNSLAAVSVVLVLMGWARRSQPYALASLAAAPLAAALPWFTRGLAPWIAFPTANSMLLAISGCLLALIVVGGFWQALEIRLQQRDGQTFSPRWRGPLAGHLAIVGGAILLALACQLCLVLMTAGWREWPPVGGLALGGTWAVLGIVAVMSLWDRRANFIFPALLAWLWMGTALAISFAPLGGKPLAAYCFHALATAAMLAVAGHLWRYGANLSVWGEKLGISDTIGGLTRIGGWLPSLTTLMSAGICGLVLLGMWNLPLRDHRVAIALAPALLAYAIGCQAQQARRAGFQLGALLLGGLCCVYLGWSDLDPGWDLSHWMTRAFRLLMVLGAVTLGYGLVLPRFVLSEASWLNAAQRAGYVSSALALTTFACLLALEVALFKPGVGAGVEGLQVAAVAVLLAVFIVGLISLAVAPGITNIADEKRRTWFVYGAQLVAGLLFAHLYLCKPDWFDGFLKPFWPYIVMAIAFVGVGFGELFWRLRLPVLAEPFQRTGAFLPVLPILGLWVVNSDHDTNYSLLLFFAGLMYLILSIVRKSWPAAIAAAVAGNGALWALLDQSGWSILQHPQFWLIPPAASVLAAAHINRDRLKPELLSTTRYGMLAVIYVSSTGEIFLHQAENSLWPPVILALLSLAGALAGVLLQIRAFLYLGAVFTLLAMVSMVWHAARAIEHVWPWWAFGIGMGISILTLLALFEKNRPQVQALVLRLRQWEQ